MSELDPQTAPSKSGELDAAKADQSVDAMIEETMREAPDMRKVHHVGGYATETASDAAMHKSLVHSPRITSGRIRTDGPKAFPPLPNVPIM